MIFFAWNAIQLVVTFSFFVDIATVAGIKYFNNSGYVAVFSIWLISLASASCLPIAHPAGCL